MTITGTNLSLASEVDFGATPATNLTVIDDTTITVDSPAGTGTVDVTVITPGGTSTTSPADQFSYVAAPTVTGLSPSFGPAAGGTLVTITGTGFTGATEVDFGMTPATNLTVVSDTTITVDSPAGTGTVDVTVIDAGWYVGDVAGRSVHVCTDRLEHRSDDRPEGRRHAGDDHGYGLHGATEVDFGMTPATNLTSLSDTR